jgi:hypothetical protein
MVTTETDLDEDFAPLDLKCTKSECEKNLHCFLPDRKMARRKQKGPCRSCGKELVDWKRLEKKDLNDVAHTIEMLKFEWIRHKYWCSLRVDPAAEAHAWRAGLRQLRLETGAILRKSVGPAKHPVQGRQTSWNGNIIFYGQHATACCCRRCIEVWHGISRKRDLTEEEIRYFTELVYIYIRYRLPGLKDAGEPE